MNNNRIVGCDIGGSHISTALVDIVKSEILVNSLSRRAINSHLASDLIINNWCDCIKETLKKEEGYSSNIMIGIAMPGPLDYGTGICLIKNQDKYEDLYGKNIKELLAEKLGIPKENIAIMNDASCFLQGEMLAGVGKLYKNSVGLTLGTGLGAAKYIKDEVLDADLWNVSFKESIAEDYLSTRWFTKSYFTAANVEIENVKKLAELAEKGDKIAIDIFETFGNNLGEFIFLNLVKYNPDIIILGGNIAKAHDFFLSCTLKYLKSKSISLDIKVANLGEMSAIYGSAGIFNSCKIL